MTDKYWIGPDNGNWNTSANWSYQSGGAANSGVPTSSDNAIFDLGNYYTIGATSTMYCRNFTITGGYYTFSSAYNLYCYGSIDWRGLCGGFTCSTLYLYNTATISTTYVTINANVSLYNSGTRTLLDDLTIDSSKQFYLYLGTLALNDHTLTVGVFTSNGSTITTNYRAISFGTYGSIRLTRIGTVTNWYMPTVSGFSCSGSRNVYIDRPDAGTTCTISAGAAAEGYALNFIFVSGSYNLVFLSGTGNTVGSIYFQDPNYWWSSFSGIWNTTGSNVIVYGDLVCSGYMTTTSTTNIMIFGGSSTTTRYINTNGTTTDWPVTFGNSSTSGTVPWVLNYHLTVRAVIHARGIIDFNSYTLTCTTYTTASGTKSINFNGQGPSGLQPKLVILNGGATAFNMAYPSGFSATCGYSSLEQGTSPPIISMTSSLPKTFVGASMNYAAGISNDGAGTLTVTGNNTFLDITNSYYPATTILPANGVQQVSHFSAYFLTLSSSVVGTQATVNNPNFASNAFIIGADYITVRDIAFTPGPVTSNGSQPYYWYGGQNSTNLGNVTGLTFIASNRRLYVIDNISVSSWYPPADWNVFDNDFFLIGGGGGGGGGYTTSYGPTSSYTGAGGGGGGFTYISNFPHQNEDGSININLGLGGPGGYGYNSQGADGGDTYIFTTTGVYGDTTSSNFTAGGGRGGGGGTTQTYAIGGSGGIGQYTYGGPGADGFNTTGIAYRGGSGGGGAGGNYGNGAVGGIGRSSGSTSNIQGGGGGNGGGSEAGPGGSASYYGGNNYQGFGGGNATVGSLRAGGGGYASTLTGVAGAKGIDIYGTIGGAGGASGYGNAVYGGGGGGGYAPRTTGGTSGGSGGTGFIALSYNTISTAPVYTVTKNVSSLAEGYSITYTISTLFVADGTTLYWTTAGTTSAEDFTDGVNSGSFVIFESSGTVTRTLLADLSSEGDETVIFQLRRTSTSGTIITTSPSVTVVDTSTSGNFFAFF